MIFYMVENATMKNLVSFLFVLLLSTLTFAKTITVYAPMTCEKCVGKIQKTIEAKLDGQFTNLTIDLDKQAISLESDTLEPSHVKEVIEYAGYPAQDKPIKKKKKK